MNFIESILHLSPDNGTGMLEAAILFVALGALALTAAVRLLRPRRVSEITEKHA